MTRPKIALVCDWLTLPGGAEKVLLELHKMYPSAPIYTSQYDPRGIDWFEDADVRTGWLQHFPKSLRKVLGPLRQRYFSRLDLTPYDLVISVTGAEAKSVQARNHLCYCHVPTQYYWGMYDRYLADPGFGFLNPIVRFIFRLIVSPLRRADYQSSRRPTQFVTISSYAAAQIRTFYHRDTLVIHPPVDTDIFSRRYSDTKETKEKSKLDFSERAPRKDGRASGSLGYQNTDPFIIVCRQNNWKRVDLAIAGCIKANQPLTVVGDGPEHQRLLDLARKLQNLSPDAPSTPPASTPIVTTPLDTPPETIGLITFVPWLDAPAVAEYLRHATAYIFPSLEPFGIAAVEALAAGTPVIAYADGGSRDFIQPGQNGLLFDQQTPESVAQALRDFNKLTFDPKTVQKSAAQFDAKHFRAKISAAVDALLEREL